MELAHAPHLVDRFARDLEPLTLTARVDLVHVVDEDRDPHTVLAATALRVDTHEDPDVTPEDGAEPSRCIRLLRPAETGSEAELLEERRAGFPVGDVQDGCEVDGGHGRRRYAGPSPVDRSEPRLMRQRTQHTAASIKR